MRVLPVEVPESTESYDSKKAGGRLTSGGKFERRKSNGCEEKVSFNKRAAANFVVSIERLNLERLRTNLKALG